MGLNSALVDRARTVRRAASPVKVEGRTEYSDVYSAWFRCRLTLGRDTESDDTPGSQKRSVRAPSLMFGVKDTEGAEVEVRFSDRVEVDSAQLGRAIWEATTEPEPMRKKRRVIGYEANLRRVVVHEPEGVL